MAEKAFEFLHHNDREEKPRETGITEIRGPYYDPMGPRELRDILETMGEYVDIYKFSGGSFALMSEDSVTELIGICHEHDVEVSTGGYIENVLIRDNDKVHDYFAEAERLGFDIVEISSGFLAMGTDDLVRLTEVAAEEYGIEKKNSSVPVALPTRNSSNVRVSRIPNRRFVRADAISKPARICSWSKPRVSRRRSRTGVPMSRTRLRTNSEPKTSSSRLRVLRCSNGTSRTSVLRSTSSSITARSSS